MEYSEARLELHFILNSIDSSYVTTFHQMSNAHSSVHHDLLFFAFVLDPDPRNFPEILAVWFPRKQKNVCSHF